MCFEVDRLQFSATQSLIDCSDVSSLINIVFNGNDVIFILLLVCLKYSTRFFPYFSFTVSLAQKSDCIFQADESKDSLLDCAVTSIVVYTFIHLHWAAVTGVQDILFFPSVPAISMLLSLAFGFAGCALLIYFQHPASDLSREFERENDVKRIAFEDLFQLAASVSVISYWRGVSICFDIFMGYFPLYWRGFDVTALVGWIMSYLMLILVHLTNSLPFKGCELDGELTDGEGCLFSTHYFLDLLADEKVNETTESCEIQKLGQADDPNNLRKRMVDGAKLHTTAATPGVCVNNNLPNGNNDPSHLKQA